MDFKKYRYLLASSRKGVTIKVASRNPLESLPDVFVIQPDTSSYFDLAAGVTPAQRMNESWTRTGNQMTKAIEKYRLSHVSKKPKFAHSN